MIYLIKTAVFIEGTIPEEDKSITALKIGYSNDERGEGRFDDYRANGFSIRVLKSIPGGSYVLEGQIHKYFKKYNIPSRSREWFYYNEEIIDLFSRCSDISELYNLFDARDDQDLVNQKYQLKSDCYKINKDLVDGLDKFLRDFPLAVNNEVYNILQDLNNLTTFPERMKLICTNSLSIDSINLLLQYLPEIIKNYYLVLGPDTCKSFSYQKYRLENEYRKVLNNQKIDKGPKILEAFKVGDRISLSDIKEKLRDIYLLIGLKKTPKATDLFEYFEIKKIKLTIDGKREDGYYILSLKSS